ncbi:3-hydroxybutyryl-CoA dehydrogenase [Oxalobacteraceae bacterium IMCC9480]|nr:3-hydroxybutyryl-CoA dehydrogenase [Oxalobacteraceae bacterium IMCC9480]NDP59104.1 3-hydroxyacyl-CoA dehydrogenase [Oxalobacteraceae bacterium]
MSESTNSVPTPAPLVGIIGCGVMGRGIAQIAVLSGATVFLADAGAGAAAAASRTLATTFATLVAKGKLQEDHVSDALTRLHVCGVLADLADCDVIIEAIVEDLAAKKTLFATLETLVRPDAILASNTSSLSVTAIAAGLQHPQRVAGFHFFNPVPLMKIVEVIGGILTTETVVTQLLALGRHWGHTAVRAKDTPGFIVNHAGRGFGTEGLRILAEGVTSVASLDRILRDTAGFKLGPCELMDMTGLDVSHPVMESIYRQYYDEPRFRPQGLTRQMLTAGLLGKKTGRGFYAYDDNGKKVMLAELAVLQAEPGAVWLSRAEPALAERLLAAGYAVESGVTPSAQALCIVTPLGQDCTDCVVQQGLDARRTVAIDALFDSPTHHVLMTNPATDPAYLARACGLFGRDGARISVLHDSTGLVAQRVLAQIINIACDIAQQGIALPADIDRGVVLGLGYPQGPLAWGDQLGAATVLRILHNIERLSGDTRYRPSPWLQRRAALGLSLLHAPA